MPMTFSERNKLAHKMGAFYEMGYWRFPSVAVKEEFERKVVDVPLPDGAVMEDLQGNFYDAQGEKV